MLVTIASATLFALAALPVQGQLTAPTTGGVPAARTGVPAGRATSSWSQWQPKPTYALNQLPDQYMGQMRLGAGSESQTGFNTCDFKNGSWNQQSNCQTAWLNSLDDFCVWGPPEPGTVGATERRAVAYCTKPNHGTRLIPDGTITGAHFLQTSEYVQISGVGDFTAIGIPLGDDGGEMDSAGADDLSNPIGGVTFTTANPATNGQPQMAAEWTNFMSHNQFCFRACFRNNAEAHCQHIYDILGCKWNMPSERGYDPGFESCDGALAPFQGVYTNNGAVTTFRQGDAVTPDPHPPASSSNCRSASSVSNGLIAATPLNQIAIANNGTSSSASGAAVPSVTTMRSPSSSGNSNNAAAGSSSSGNAASAATSNNVLASLIVVGTAAALGAVMIVV